MDTDRLIQAVRHFPEHTLLVAGDMVLDEFMYTEIDRVSREAPVFICRYQKSDAYPGCAGNTAMNVRSLGADAIPCGLVGEDEDADRILSVFRAAGMDVSGVQRTHRIHTMKKMRVLAGGVHRAKQHMLRVDWEAEDIHFQLYRSAGPHIDKVDGIIISDYGSNTVTPYNTKKLFTVAKERNIPIFVDSRYRCTAFKNVDAITPNEEEAATVLKRPVPENGPELVETMETLARWAHARFVLLTRGSKGMVAFERGASDVLTIPIYGSDEPVDVSGAGDSVMATFALAMVSGLPFADAARLANMAGGISVMRKGTYPVRRSDLLEALHDHHPTEG